MKRQNPAISTSTAALFVLSLEILLGSLVGCNPGGAPTPATTSEVGSSGETTSANPNSKKFAVSYQTIDNPFFTDLTTGLRSVIESRGDALQVYDASFDARNQAQQLSDLIQGQFDGIFLNPVNWKGVGRSLHKAREAKVPVIVVDAPVQDRSLVVATVASDNYAAGRLAGEALVKTRPSGAKIAMLTYSVNKACRDRVTGFKAALENKPAFSVEVEQELRSGTREAAYPLTRDILLRSPDLTAIFAINDPAALGALRALDQSGKIDQVTLLAVDGNSKALAEITKGRMLGTSAQFPEEIGSAAAKAMYEHIDGKKVEPDLKIRVQFIDRSNASSVAAGKTN